MRERVRTRDWTMLLLVVVGILVLLDQMSGEGLNFDSGARKWQFAPGRVSKSQRKPPGCVNLSRLEII